jgi:hypothetical protein
VKLAEHAMFEHSFLVVAALPAASVQDGRLDRLAHDELADE